MQIDLGSWFRRLFRRRRGYRYGVVPVMPQAYEMQEKDPALFEEIGPLSIPEGLERWRQKYPGDFADAD